MMEANCDIIEWKNGAIHIYDPERLEKEVLTKHFRSAKLASFQRQLHYFAFRKEAGFGKFTACTYVSEETTRNIKSLLTIKRRKPARKGLAAAAAQKNKSTARTPAPPPRDALATSAHAFSPMSNPRLPGLLLNGEMKILESMRNTTLSRQHLARHLLQQESYRRLLGRDETRLRAAGSFPSPFLTPPLPHGRRTSLPMANYMFPHV